MLQVPVREPNLASTKAVILVCTPVNTTPVTEPGHKLT